MSAHAMTEVEMRSPPTLQEIDNLAAESISGNGEYSREVGRCLSEQSAGEGSVVGLYNLSVVFAFGMGARRNEALAVKLERLAAERGDVDAIVALGFRYLNGFGVKQNIEKGMRYYRQSAALGDSSGIFSVGQYHFDRREYDKAFHFLSAGADMGHKRCLYLIGRIHLFGLGRPQDPVAATLALTAAKERGSVAAKRLLESKAYLKKMSKRSPKASQP